MPIRRQIGDFDSREGAEFGVRRHHDDPGCANLPGPGISGTVRARLARTANQAPGTWPSRYLRLVSRSNHQGVDQALLQLRRGHGSDLGTEKPAG